MGQVCAKQCEPMCVSADRVLEAEQHQLDLVDGGGVEVEVQFELGNGGRHDPSLRRMDEVPKDADDLFYVFNRQLELLAALFKNMRLHLKSLNLYMKCLHSLFLHGFIVSGLV